MTDTTLPTEPLRAEHRELLPHLQGLETVADEVDRWDADEAAHVLGDIIGFLRGHLVPHAEAEEQVLYPAVEQAMAAPGATATMRADHAEIVSRIDRLADTAATVADRWPRQSRDPRRDPPARGAGSHPAAALPQGGGGPATAFAVLVGRRARCESERASPRNIRRANTLLGCPDNRNIV